MESKEFELGNEDAAIIFRKGEGIELILPKMTDKDVVDVVENNNIFVAMSIAASMKEKPFTDLIARKIDSMLRMAEEEGVINAPECTCGSEDDKCALC